VEEKSGDLLGEQLEPSSERERDQEESDLAIGTGPIRAPRLGEVLIALDHVSPEQVAEGLRAQRQAATKNVRVLVVDDSSIARRLVIRGLVSLGYDVVAYEDPTRVIEDLSLIAPDIVVTDLYMPDLDGAELCRRIKAATAASPLPVVILTGGDIDETTANAGADDVVRKGMSMEELATRIDAIVRRTNAASRIRKLFVRDTCERRDVSIMFADIRELTSFAETHEPAEVMATLNDVLGRLAGCVAKWGGTIGKFRGDGMMVVFGAPLRVDDHAGRAVSAAREMLATMRMHANAAVPAMKIAIGISSGVVITGWFGSEQRSEYTCIGDTVEAASRLCSYAESQQILVGASTVERHQDRTRFTEMPQVKLKRSEAPAVIYRAISHE
jgi:adenylate cyclase